MKSLILFSIVTFGLNSIFELGTKMLYDFSKEKHKNIVLKNNTKTIEEYEFVDNLDKENKTLTEYQSVIRTVKNDEAS